VTLTLRQRIRRGRPWWYVEANVQLPDGSRARKERKSPLNTRRDAEAFGRELERVLATGKHGRPIPTLADFWPDYLAWADVNNKPATKTAKEKAGRLHLLPRFGKLRLDAIGTVEFETLKTGMLKEKYAPHTVNNVLGYLHRALTLAKKLGKTAHEVSQADKIDYHEAEAEWLEPEEQERFAGAAHYWPERFPVLLSMLDGGLRIGEALGLRQGDVDTRRQVLVVRRTRVAVTASFGRPKEGPTRDVHLTHRLASALKAHRHLKSELVFTTADGRPLTHSMVKRWVADAARRAGIAKHVTNHSLRHSRTATLVMAGCTEDFIMKQLGWTTTSVLRRYSHLSVSHAKDEVRRAEAFLATASKKVEET
jgi:integrase